jgi:hypothetical protein
MSDRKTIGTFMTSRARLCVPIFALFLVACEFPETKVSVSTRCAAGTDADCNAATRAINVAGNPAEVTLTNPNVGHLIALTDPAFADLALSIPKGSFNDTITMTIERRPLDQSAGASLMRLGRSIARLFINRNGADDTEVISITGNQALLKDAQLTLPQDWTTGLSPAEKDVLRVRVYDLADQDTSIIIPHEQLTVLSIDESERFSFSFNDWGLFTAEADATPPTLSLKTAIPSPNRATSLNVIIEASWPNGAEARGQP